MGASQDEKEIKIEDFGISEEFKFECESNLINLSFYCSKLIVYFLLIFFWQRYFVRKVKKFKLTLKETKLKRLLRERTHRCKSRYIQFMNYCVHAAAPSQYPAQKENRI